jgi:hypothetical protein
VAVFLRGTNSIYMHYFEEIQSLKGVNFRFYPVICLRSSGTLRKPLWGYPASWPRIRRRTANHSTVMLSAAVITPATHNMSSRTHWEKSSYCEYCYRTTSRIPQDSTLHSHRCENLKSNLAIKPKSLSNEPNFAAHIASRDNLPPPHGSNSLLAILERPSEQRPTDSSAQKIVNANVDVPHSRGKPPSRISLCHGSACWAYKHSYGLRRGDNAMSIQSELTLYSPVVTIVTTCFNTLNSAFCPVCICVFRMALTINRDYFPKQH